MPFIQNRFINFFTELFSIRNITCLTPVNVITIANGIKLVTGLFGGSGVINLNEEEKNIKLQFDLGCN